MRPAIIIGAIAGLVVLSAAIRIGGLSIADDAPSVEVEHFELDDPEIGTETTAGPDIAGQKRVIAPGDSANAPLERIEPREPLSKLALAVPPEPGLPKPTLLHQPVGLAAGRIEAEGHTIEIDGISVVETERQCDKAGGGRWPCGMFARTAFRNWLRGRAVECTVSDVASREPVITACALGKQDVAQWLVENGLATAEDGGPLVETGKKAQRERKGIFGDGPGG